MRRCRKPAPQPAAPGAWPPAAAPQPPGGVKHKNPLVEPCDV